MTKEKEVVELYDTSDYALYHQGNKAVVIEPYYDPCQEGGFTIWNDSVVSISAKSGRDTYSLRRRIIYTVECDSNVEFRYIVKHRENIKTMNQWLREIRKKGSRND